MVDTCVLINFRGNKASKKEKKQFVNLDKYLCPQIVLEFLRGEKEQKKELERLKEAFTIVEFNDNVYLVYSKIYKELKKQGILKSERDLLIASFCIAYNLKLWTKNIKDFKIFEGYGLKII